MKGLSMRHLFFFRFILFFIALSFAASAQAGEPTEQVKETTDKILSILNDRVLKNPEKAEARRKMVWEAVDERFDWEELARRSMGPHWAKLSSPEERKEFIGLYSSLLRRTYLHRVDEYSGEKVRYEQERIDGDYASVQVRIMTAKGREIPAAYRLRKKGGDWRVYDIQVEGVSLVNNYRAQFNSILVRSSIEELFKILKERVAKESSNGR
jgi:phospholipid transport system substrate-binding protein